MTALKPRVGTLLAAGVLLSLTVLLGYQIQPAHSDKQTSTRTQDHNEVKIIGTNGRTAAAAIAGSDLEWTDPLQGIDVKQLAQRADLIVVGRIKQVQGPRYLEVVHNMHNPNHPVVQMPLDELRKQMFYELDVDRVIKGNQALSGTKLKWVDPNWALNIHSNSRDGVTYRDEARGGIPQLSYGLFFLNGEKEQIRFVDKNHAVLPASPLPMPVVDAAFAKAAFAKAASSGSSDASSAVIDELIHVLDTPLAVLSAKGGAAGGESASGTENYSISSGEVLMRDAVTVLEQTPTEDWQRSMKLLTGAEHTPLTRLWAFAALVEKNDWSSFPDVLSLLLAPSQDLHYVASYPFQSLKEKIQRENGQAVLTQLQNSQLIELLKSSDASIRESASFMLAQKKDANLIEVLAQTANRDKDEIVRTNCFEGLMQLTNIGTEFWQKEPQLALDMTSGKNGAEPFDDSMRKGSKFEQNKMTASVDHKLAVKPLTASQYPQWVTNAKSWRPASVRERENESELGGQDGRLPGGWSWEGSESAQTGKRIWYTIRKTYSPQSESEDRFVVRTTTIAFMIEPGDGNYPQVSDDLKLPSAKILDVWQENDDTIYKRQSRDKVRVLKLTRFFGADGRALRVSPAGVQQQASVEDLEAK